MLRYLITPITALLSVLVHAAPLTSPESFAVGTYPQEIRTAYTMADGLPSDNVLCIAVTDGGVVFAGTDKGLAKFDGESWIQVFDIPAAPVAYLLVAPEGLYVAVDNKVYAQQDTAFALINQMPGPIISLALITVEEHETALLLQSADGFMLPTEGFGKHLRDPAWETPGSINDVIAKGENLWIATNSGAYKTSSQHLEAPTATNSISDLFPRKGSPSEVNRPSKSVALPILPRNTDTGWAPTDVRALALHDDLLILAAPQGVAMENGDGSWNLYTGREGLPYNDFTSMDVAPDGRLWLGTTKGAIHFDGTQWAWRAGKRWLPNDEVRDVAATADGAWIATAGGVSHIHFKPMTFAEKAKFYEDEIDQYHRRTPYEYVAGVSLETAGDKSKWKQKDTDNDGQYTGLYGAGECLAYAATGDPKAKARATKAFEALAFLSEVTQSGSNPAPKGFIARTILPTDGPNPNEHDSPEKDRRKQEQDALWKVIVPRWPTSGDGKWYWKTDASSDELDGHFLLYGTYFDHVAETEAEKARAREVTARVMDHLIEHEYKLVDHDGQPTRWANFSPASVNGDPDWWAERGLNSISLLTYLSVTHHVTGEQKYRDLFLDLVNNHHYAMNGMVAPKLQAGPGSYVQFDDKMAFMNYYHLIRYETDPKILRMFQNSIFYYWQIEQYERNPFFNFVYAACCLGKGMETQWGVTDLSPTGHWLEDSVDTLKRFPMDLVMWPMNNSHRIDLLPLPSHVREPGQAEGKGFRVDMRVIPIDERTALTYSEDAWKLDDDGGKGKTLDDGGPFLLGYYLGLYHGFITE
jgi:hypothetical protein